MIKELSSLLFVGEGSTPKLYIEIYKYIYIIVSMINTTNTANIFKSLADDTRLSIVRKLARDNCEVTSQDIVSDCAFALKLSQPTMSHHFQRLVASGVVDERKEGVEKYYQLNRTLLASVGIDADRL